MFCSKDFSLGGFNFTIRPCQPEDDLATYRNMFIANDCMINIGKEREDEDMIKCGEEYCRGAFKAELSSYDALMKVFGNNDSVFWVLVDRDSNDIVGSVALERKDGNMGELRRMVTSHKYRRKGVGTAIVRFLLDYAKSKGLIKVNLSTPAVNIPGIKMYEGAGFLHTGDENYPLSDTVSVGIRKLSYDLQSHLL